MYGWITNGVCIYEVDSVNDEQKINPMSSPCVDESVIRSDPQLVERD